MSKIRFLTSGESHGQGLSIIIEGIPAGLSLSEDYIQKDLARRQKGYGRGGRMKIEKDRALIKSGVRHGVTLGSPIGLWIQNRDWENWQEVMAVDAVNGQVKKVTRLRPGHADMPGILKYKQDDVRNILERASARETAARVAVGAVCRALLSELSVEIHSNTLSIAGHGVKNPMPEDWGVVEESVVRCHEPDVEQRMIGAIDDAKESGDTVGGVFQVVASGTPIGLGSHVHWDRKLDANLAQAMMSINAVKGVEIGPGFKQAQMVGSLVHDVIEPFDGSRERKWKRMSNRAGGIEGGMSNGEDIVVRVAIKPISTLAKPLPSVDLATGEKIQAHYERSDVCQAPPGGIVGEAMMAIVLADAVMEKFGGDHVEETVRNCRSYLETVKAPVEATVPAES